MARRKKTVEKRKWVKGLRGVYRWMVGGRKSREGRNGGRRINGGMSGFFGTRPSGGGWLERICIVLRKRVARSDGNGG